MENIKLELSLNEVNLALTALAEMPFKTTNELITKIRSQAVPQVTGADEPPKAVLPTE